MSEAHKPHSSVSRITPYAPPRFPCGEHGDQDSLLVCPVCLERLEEQAEQWKRRAVEGQDLVERLEEQLEAQAEQYESLGLALDASINNHAKDNAYLIQQRDEWKASAQRLEEQLEAMRVALEDRYGRDFKAARRIEDAKRIARIEEQLEALREWVDEYERFLSSMPDAGLTADDPRSAWFMARPLYPNFRSSWPAVRAHDSFPAIEPQPTNASGFAPDEYPAEMSNVPNRDEQSSASSSCARCSHSFGEHGQHPTRSDWSRACLVGGCACSYFLPWNEDEPDPASSPPLIPGPNGPLDQPQQPTHSPASEPKS